MQTKITAFAILSAGFCKYVRIEINVLTFSDLFNNKPSFEITGISDADKLSATNATLFLLLQRIAISL